MEKTIIVRTKSGSFYSLTLVDGIFKATKIQESGDTVAEVGNVVAIRPSLLPNLMATKTIKKEGQFHVGFNEKGGQTLRIIPDQIKTGMILANRRGVRSTEIVAIV
jgi:hypothetical protein